MRKIYSILSLVAVLALIAAPSSAYNARAWDTVTFSGQATGVLVMDGNTNPIFASTDSLPPEGGELDANTDAVSEETIQTGNIDSVTTGFDEQAESRVSASSIVLLPGTDTEITADFAGADTIATCDGTTGTSIIDNLVVEGRQLR